MVKMGALLKTLVFVMVLIINVPVYKGNVTLSCFPDKPRLNSPLFCQCREARGRNIEWYRGNRYISTCSASRDRCIRKPTDYQFINWMDGSVSYYNLTVKRCEYSDCAEFRCLDFSAPPNEAKQRIEVTQFDSNFSSKFKEPGSSHKSGYINFTTQCISDPHSVKRNIKFYKIKNNVMSEFEPLRWNVTEGTVSCATCNGKPTAKLTISFDHEEPMGTVDEVQFRVTLFHDKSDEPVDNCLHTLAGVVVLVTVLSWVIMVSIKLCCQNLKHHIESRLAHFNCMCIIGEMMIFVQAIPFPCIYEIVVMIFHHLKHDRHTLERPVWKLLVSFLVDVICVTVRLCVCLLDGNPKTKVLLIWLSISLYLILNVIATCIMRLVQGAPHSLQEPNAENLTQPSGQSIDQGQSERLLAGGQDKATPVVSIQIELPKYDLKESIDEEDNDQDHKAIGKDEILRTDSEHVIDSSDTGIGYQESGLKEPIKPKEDL